MAVRSAEYIPNRTFTKRIVPPMTVVAAVVCGMGAVHAEPPSQYPPVSADTSVPWNEQVWLDLLHRIFRDLRGDEATWSANAHSAESAMNLITQQYVSGVVYPAPDDPSAGDLWDAIRSAACMVRTAPATLNDGTVEAFLKTITCEWIDLGGYPGDLGC